LSFDMKMNCSAQLQRVVGWIQYRGPAPRRDARSPGLANWQRSSDRQPQPMHSARRVHRSVSSSCRTASPSTYGATKAALELLTRTIAAELRDRGIAAVLVDPGDMRTRMHQEAFPGEDISDRPPADVTAPFWNWLFDQDPDGITGRRFAAQQEASWLQPV
jgi:NAD(P)-dependent dehydrogenase (short-subunit alcohol dehydrogenase family)